MKRLFLSITKGEEIRFLGHLDFLRTLERAVLRAEIPAVFSEGFNPHMKIALDAALGVGVEADPIYLELRVEDSVSLEEVRERLAPQLLKGIRIHDIREVAPEWPKLINYLNEDSYEAEGPVSGTVDEARIQEETARFNGLDSFVYQRVTPKKVREIDIMPLLTEPVAVRIDNGRAYVTFSFLRTRTGSIQPKDIWKILAESFHMPWMPGEFVCRRCGVYHRENGVRMTPFDEAAFPAATQEPEK